MALVFRALRRGASRGTGVIALCDRSERAQHAIAADLAASLSRSDCCPSRTRTGYMRGIGRAGAATSATAKGGRRAFLTESTREYW
jgi:hypothetical protein